MPRDAKPEINQYSSRFAARRELVWVRNTLTSHVSAGQVLAIFRGSLNAGADEAGYDQHR
jgi:hypothetical protein